MITLLKALHYLLHRMAEHPNDGRYTGGLTLSDRCRIQEAACTMQKGIQVRTRWPSQAAKLYQRGRLPFLVGLLKVKDYLYVFVNIFLRADMKNKLN
jgi:hypothetical protein